MEGVNSMCFLSFGVSVNLFEASDWSSFQRANSQCYLMPWDTTEPPCDKFVQEMRTALQGSCCIQRAVAIKLVGIAC